MTDIQSQMEANGLPSTFESTSDQPVEERMVENIAAAASNSGAAPTNDIKQAANLPLASSTLVEPVTTSDVLLVPESQSTPGTNGVSLTNGDEKEADMGAGIQVNGHDTSLQPEPVVDAVISESVVPSSMPSESHSTTTTSTTTIDLLQPQPTTDIFDAQPSAVPEQQPTSDIRTEPHSDALGPEAVSDIEERKHEEDNNAPLPIASDTSSLAPAPVLSEDISLTAAANGLLSPHARSPPPAPEMSHASLPFEPSAAGAETIAVPETVETPAAPAPTPAIPATKDEDTEMVEAPAPVNSVKAARGREEDEMELDEPSAKRVKTDPSPGVEQPAFKLPDTPLTTNASQTKSTTSLKFEGDPSVTAPRLGHMKKIISNLKKSSASTAFRIPVDYKTLNIPNYPEIVKQPMDLGTIDTKLKHDQYADVRDFITDFELIVNNCVLFNGKEHGITLSALKMQSSFSNQMSNLPPANIVEPSKAEKKAMKVKTEPVRAIPPRRPSVTTPGSAKSPKPVIAATTPSFAPGPDGMPLIRRDSSIVDGRPKRAIVPPKRNSDFAGVRPKKKKYELQLRFCQEVLKEIMNPKHWALNQYFTHPVDPVALNIPTYFQIIKKPMDLSTISTKLEGNQYEKAKDFEEDVRLIFKNCYKFNPKEDYVNQTGHQLEELFNRKWAQKDDWIAAREPQSEPPSDAEEEEDDEDTSEEAEQDSEDDRNDKIKLLQAQIEAMSKQMGELTQPKKKKKSSPPAPKKSKSKTKKDKPASTFPNLTKSQDKKKKITTKPKAEKDRYVTFAEKQYISNGIGMLPERQMQEALRIIQQSVPSLANSDGEIELDIEEVPNHALLKLLTFVKKYAGPPPDEPETKTETFSATAAPTKSKKNKPMSKQEQEAQIEELKGKLNNYSGGPASPDAVASGEGNESSDDSADSEESEEE